VTTATGKVPGGTAQRAATPIADGALMREVSLLRALRAVTADRLLLPEEDLRASLAVACDHLGLAMAVLSHASAEGALETVATCGPPRPGLPLDYAWAALQEAPDGLLLDAAPSVPAGLAVMVTVREQRYGMLTLWGDAAAGALGTVELELARLVAFHLGVCLDLKDRLSHVAAALDDMADSPGEEVFARLAKRTAILQQVAYVVVGEAPRDDATLVRPRAVWCRGAAAPAEPYLLAGTPCAAVLRGEIVHYERNVAAHFPNDPRLAALGAESFLGVPMLGPAGDVVGHLALIHTEPMPPDSGRVKLLRELARRAATDVAFMRAEESRRTSEERLALAVSTTGIAVWDANLVTGEIHLNEHAKMIAGLDAVPDRIDLSVWQMLVADAEVDHLRPMLRSAAGGDETSFEHQVRHPNGSIRWLFTRMRVAERVDDRATRLVAVGLDVTDRRRDEEQVRESQRLESLGVLAGGIAHDFNNLLMSILGNATLALRTLPADAPASERMRSIETAARRAAELTDQMLTYAGQGATTVERVELSAIVGEMTRLLETVISKSATLRIDGQPAAADGDPAQLRQVVMNLITNASDAIGETRGSIVVTTGTMEVDEAFLAESRAADRLAPGTCSFLAVRDSGHGMDEATRRRVFDPFFTTRFTGRGLGMAAVSGIVRRHGGAIRIESEVGVGTTVTVVLPRAALAAEPAAAAAPAPPPFEASGTVLVIDDDAMVQNLVRYGLASAGFEVLAASDGPAGLACFDAHADEIRLVVLDLTMPHMSGVQVLAALRARAPETPVLLMSGYSVETALDPTVIPDDQPFLHKPFDLDTLLRRVQAVLAHAGAGGA